MSVKIFDTHALTNLMFCSTPKTEEEDKQRQLLSIRSAAGHGPAPRTPARLRQSYHCRPNDVSPPAHPNVSLRCITLWRSCPSPSQLLPLCLCQSLLPQPYALEVSNQVQKGLVIAGRQPHWGGERGQGGRHSLGRDTFLSLAVVAVFPSLLRGGSGGGALTIAPRLLPSRGRGCA